MFDDTRPWDEKLTLYRDSIENGGDMFTINRSRPIHLPVAEAEPLKQEMQAFITSCETGLPAPTAVDDALAVQRVLHSMMQNFAEFGTAEDAPSAARERG